MNSKLKIQLNQNTILSTSLTKESNFNIAFNSHDNGIRDLGAKQKEIKIEAYKNTGIQTEFLKILERNDLKIGDILEIELSIDRERDTK